MHPEILSISLFWFVTAYTPGPNNVVASYSGFNFGITKTIPHILGVTFGFTSLVLFLSIGLINVFKLFPIIQVMMRYLGTLFLIDIISGCMTRLLAIHFQICVMGELKLLYPPHL
jgi:threonine/homoserine/homoserine lactone efflux protein